MNHKEYREKVSYAEAEVAVLKRQFLTKNGWAQVLTTSSWMWGKRFNGAQHFFTEDSALSVEIHTQKLEESIHGDS